MKMLSFLFLSTTSYALPHYYSNEVSSFKSFFLDDLSHRSREVDYKCSHDTITRYSDTEVIYSSSVSEGTENRQYFREDDKLTLILNSTQKLPGRKDIISSSETVYEFLDDNTLKTKIDYRFYYYDGQTLTSKVRSYEKVVAYENGLVKKIVSYVVDGKDVDPKKDEYTLSKLDPFGTRFTSFRVSELPEPGDSSEVLKKTSSCVFSEKGVNHHTDLHAKYLIGKWTSENTYNLEIGEELVSTNIDGIAGTGTYELENGKIKLKVNGKTKVGFVTFSNLNSFKLSHEMEDGGWSSVTYSRVKE